MARKATHDKPIIPAHIQQLSFNVTCDICKKRKREIWKKYKKIVCWQCGNGFLAKTTSRPFKPMMLAALALMLVMLAGCQTSKARIEIQCAGQSVKCEFRR